jgi:hypothetical protein
MVGKITPDDIDKAVRATRVTSTGCMSERKARFAASLSSGDLSRSLDRKAPEAK